MATTFVEYTGDGNATKTFSFPSYQSSDVKVRVDSVLKTASTHYNITSYTTTGGGNVVFTSGNIPSSPANIRIYRDTSVDAAKATYTAGSSVKAADLNNNNTQLLYRAQEEQIPNLIHSYDIDAAGIETSNIKDANVTTAKIADSNVTTAKIADSNVTTAKIADNAVTLAKLNSGALPTDITVASANIVNGTIVEADIANSAVTSNKIADNAVTTTEILNGAVTRDKIAADAIDGTKLADNAVDSEHYTDGSIDRVHLEADIIDSTKLADNAVNSEHYVDGSIDREHLAAGIVDGTKIAAASISTDKIENNAVTDSKIATGTLDNRYFTETELANGALDGRYFTETESDARYFNISTGDTIKDGDSFPDNDTTIATTAAINDRIVDLVEEVGGFIPIANETSFPTNNPDINSQHGGDASRMSGTIISVKTASTNLAPSGTTVTIANGRGSGLAVIITGVTATIPSGFGFLVETTSTDHTYAFHRLTPKATEVTTVAGSIGNINTVGNAISNVNAVAGNATNINTVAANNTNVTNVGGNISNVNAVHANASNINTVAGINANVTTVAGISSNVTSVAGNTSNINSAVSNASNINSAVSNASNINTVAGAISNVNTTAGSISNVNSVASNMANVNNFADRYQIASSDPSTDGGGNALAEGDLYFNTSADELKVYNGGAWQGGVTASGNFAATTGNTFTGDNLYNDNVKAKFGTGSDLGIYHNGSHTYIENNTGTLYLRAKVGENSVTAFPDGTVKLAYDDSTKLETTSSGVEITGKLTFATEGLAGGSIDLGIDADLNLYHDNSNAYIDNNTGHFYIRNDGNSTSEKVILQAKGGEQSLIASPNGSVELYYDNSKKFETTANGVNIESGSPHFQVLASTDGENALLSLIGKTGSGGIGQVAIARIEAESKQSSNGASAMHLKTRKTNNTVTTAITIDENQDINFPIDNQKLKLGTAADLQIYHDGNNSVLSNATGTLYYLAGTQQIMNLGGTETMAKFIENGAVELYHNNSKKFETHSAGVLVSGNVYANDNNKFIAGTSNDLQIYHDGSHSRIDEVGTGNLIMKSNVFRLRSTGDEEMIIANENGNVQLYYDNSKKFETVTGGATITGVCTATSFAGDGSSLSGINTDLVSDTSPQLGGNLASNGNNIDVADSTNSGNNRIKFGTSADLSIYHNGNHSFIEESGTGALKVLSSNIQLLNAAGNETMIQGTENGAVELYYDNSKKLKTHSSGVFVSSDANLGRIILGDTSGNYGYQLTGYDAGSAGNGGRLVLQDANGGMVLDSRVSGGNMFLYNTVKLNGNGSADNLKLIMGAGEDLQIWHDGSESYVKNANASSNLILESAHGVHIKHGGENMAKFVQDGAVELYYDNSQKFKTTSTGASMGAVTHTLQWPYDGTSSSRSWGFIGEDGAYGKFELKYSNGADTTLDEVSTRFYANAEVQLFYDNSLKFRTLSTGSQIYGGDLRFVSTGWTGESCKIQHHNNSLYIQGGTGGHRFRRNNGNDCWIIDSGGTLYPASNNTYDIGTTSTRVRNIYTNDLHLSNEGHSNDVDGTWGNWTIQEGESDLFLKNNRSGKKYKFNLTEVS